MAEDMGDTEAPGAPADATEALSQALAEHGPGDAGKLISWLQEYGFDVVPSGGTAISIGVGLEGAEDAGMEMPEMPTNPFDLEGMRKSASARALRKQ